MTRYTLIALAALALTACSQSGQEGEPSNPPPPADAPPGPPAPAPAVLGGVDLNQPVRLVGTEPFWGMDITREKITLSGADRAEQSGPNAGVTVSGRTAAWTVKTTDGATLSITLSEGQCSDGMSDRTYPLNAEVRVDKPTAVTFKGCAASKAGIEHGGESGPVK